MNVSQTTAPYVAPVALSIGRDAIFDIAEQLSTANGYSPDCSLATLIVDRLRGEIVFNDQLNLAQDATIYVEGIGDFKIELPCGLPVETERFCLAHELGHYFLHFFIPSMDNEQMSPIRAFAAGEELAEYEANWFAAAFLLPKAIYTTKYNACAGDHAVLASYFQVPIQLSSNRAISLGLATAP
jgi:hypothetical protein